MRKIISKREERKKRKRTQLLVAGIMVFLMLFSVFGYVMNSASKSSVEKKKYGDYTFVKQNGIWTLNKYNYDFSFSSLPDELINVEISGNLSTLNNYNSKILYLYSEDSYSESKIYSALSSFVSRIQLACESEENCPGNYPVKDCTENFIIIKKSDTNKISQINKCVYIEGDEANLSQVTEEFLYRILEVKD